MKRSFDMVERTSLKFLACALVGAALLGGGIARSAEREARFSHPGTDQTVCPCCADDADSICCKGCSFAALKRFSPLEKATASSITPTPSVGYRSNVLDFSGMTLSPPTQSATMSTLHACRYVNQIGTVNNPEQSDARNYFKIPEVVACNAAVTALHSRNEVDLLSSKQPFSPDDQTLINDYVHSCLTPQASIYTPHLKARDIEEINARLTFILSNDERNIDCEGFRLNNYVVTAAHCIGQIKEGDFVKVRGVKSPQVLIAKVAFIGTKDSRQHPDLDYGLLQIQERIDNDSERDLAWLDSPRPLGRLFIMQANIFTLISKDIPITSPLADAINVQDNPICRAINAPPSRFILDSCQAEGGTSGSPYIQRGADGSLHLVGVHAGLTSFLASNDLSDCAWVTPNYGVVLPIEELKASMR